MYICFVRNKFLQRLLASILIFGLGLHAIGAVQLFSNTLDKSQTVNVSSFLKKSDQIGVFDIEDTEFEDTEFEDTDKKSGDLFASQHFVKFILNKNRSLFFSSEFERNHSYKLPLFIHFQNYRL